MMDDSWKSAKLRLRNDLRFSSQRSGDQVVFIVEDPVQSKFYQVGKSEYFFLSHLNGQNSAEQALKLANSQAGVGAELSLEQARKICDWLVRVNLVQTASLAHVDRFAENSRQEQQRKRKALLNPFSIKIPLVNPDRFLQSVLPFTAWIFSRTVFTLWCVIVAVALVLVYQSWDRFTISSQGILSSGRWIWLAVSWLGLKVIHEFAHGLVCRNYGGQVRESGIMFMFFMPVAYVDVTSSWKFRNRWLRIFVAAAGMYAEILVAAIAAILWCTSPESVLADLYYNVMLSAGLSTILFNANPLMRFDGYYIFSDLVRIPNLYSQGQQILRHWARKYLLGVTTTFTAESRLGYLIIALYGCGAFWWRMLVCLGWILTCTTLLDGAGLVLAGLAIVMWFGIPAARFLKYLIAGTANEQPNRLRFALFASGGGLVIAVLGVFIQMPARLVAPAIVEFAPLTVVRASADGFVRQIHVEDGQFVEADQLIAVLESLPLENEVAALKLAVQQSTLQARIYQRSGRIAQYQAEKKTRESLEKKLAEKLEQRKRLVVRSPLAGRVIRPRLDELSGTFLSEGDEIVSIGNPCQKELKASVAQADVDSLLDRQQVAVTVLLSGHTAFKASLARVDPQASVVPLHPALCASADGPLPVRQVDPQQSPDGVQLISPRFTATIPLSADLAESVYAGQRAEVFFWANERSLGGHLYEFCRRWIRTRVDKISGS